MLKGWREMRGKEGKERDERRRQAKGKKVGARLRYGKKHALLSFKFLLYVLTEYDNGVMADVGSARLDRATQRDRVAPSACRLSYGPTQSSS